MPPDSPDRMRSVIELRTSRSIGEAASGAVPDLPAVETSLREITKLGGAVRLAAPGSLANDGKVISDERDYSA